MNYQPVSHLSRMTPSLTTLQSAVPGLHPFSAFRRSFLHLKCCPLSPPSWALLNPNSGSNPSCSPHRPAYSDAFLSRPPMAQPASSYPWRLLPVGSLNSSPMWDQESPKTRPSLEGEKRSLFSPEQPCFRVIPGTVHIPNSMKNSETYPHSGQNLLTADQQVP